MRCFKRFLVVLIVLLFTISFQFSSPKRIYAASSNDISSNQFFEKTKQMISEHGMINNGLSDSLSNSTNRIIVKTSSNNPIDSLNAVDSVEGFNNWHILQFNSTEDTNNAIDFFSKQDYVEYVELDFVFSIINTELYKEDPVCDIVPSLDDYGCVMVNTEPALGKAPNNLKNIIVAVFDTGISENHPYFDSTRILNDGNSLWGTSTDDGNWHGTHVSGIIYNNTPSNVKIRPYKVLSDNGMGCLLSIALTVPTAVDNGADIINMSLGRLADVTTRNTFSDAVSYAKSKNVPVIVSAGNDYTQLSAEVPAIINDCITVSSVNDAYLPSEFSNYGHAVDIAAPGEQINSSVPYNNKYKANDKSYNYHYYLTASGTSMSTPFVSAAAAILLTINPELTVSNIETILKQTAYVPDNWDYDYGAGIVDFEKMLTMTQKAEKPKISLTENGATISADPNAKVYYTTNHSLPNKIDSQLYTGEPISTSGITVIKAIAYIDGMLESDVTSFSVKWTENHTIPYKGRYKLKMPSNIEKFTISNEEVISFDGERIKGNNLGKSQLTIYLETGQKVTCNVTVEFADWQIIHEIFYKLFGVLLWCFEFNC